MVNDSPVRLFLQGILRTAQKEEKSEKFFRLTKAPCRYAP
jgi:hypothetical protein